MAVTLLLLSLVVAPVWMCPVKAESDYVEILIQYRQAPAVVGNCLAASIQMVLRYIMFPDESAPSQDTIMAEMNNTPTGYMMHLPFYNRKFNKVLRLDKPNPTYTSNIIPKITVQNITEYLKSQLSKKYVSIVAGNYDVGQRGVHAVVAIGYDERGRNKYMIVHDPGDGGKERYIEYSQFTKSFDRGLLVPYEGYAEIRVPEFPYPHPVLFAAIALAVIMSRKRRPAVEAVTVS